MGKPSAVATKIVPKKAAEWLETCNGDGNRSLMRSLVGRYARDIRFGRWALNGEPIVFGKSGRLLDGQHRLHACVEAGVPFTTMVVTGVDDEAFDTIDGGVARGAKDVLSIRGIGDSGQVAAVARLIYKHEQGNAMASGAGMQPTTREVEDVVDRHPEIEKSASVGRRARNILHRGLAGYLHWAFSQKDADLADTFMERLITGENLMADDPVYLLRERLVLGRAGKTRLIRREVAALTIKAWNAVRKGATVKVLKTDAREAFPEIV